MSAASPVRATAVLHVGEISGPAKTLLPRLAALAELGSVEVVVPRRGPAADLYDPVAKTTVLAYGPLAFPRTLGGLVALVARFIVEVRAFRRHLRRTRPDVVIVATTVLPAAVVGAWLARVPVVVYAAEVLDRAHSARRARSFANALARAVAAKLAAAVVCSSATVARAFGDEREKVSVVYPGIASHPSGDRDGFRARFGLSAAGPLVAVVGNVTRGRGQDVVLAALPRLVDELPDIGCAIVGATLERAPDVSYRRELERLVSDLGVAERVVFTGFVERIEDVYAGADVVVNPTRVEEGFGRVAVEALVAGRPVVASRIGAVAEVLRDGEDALLVEPDDPAELAAAIARLWNEPDLRERLVRTASERVLREYGERRGVEQFVDVVTRVLERDGQAVRRRSRRAA